MTINFVLDTNVVLDWLVFDNAFMNALRDGVRDRRVVVLTYSRLSTSYSGAWLFGIESDAGRQTAILADYRRHSETAVMPRNSELTT